MGTRNKIKKLLHLPLIILAQVLSLWVNEAVEALTDQLHFPILLTLLLSV